jgi:uncharacterized protein YdhG (YjbR/CyaY superfamily)
MARPDHKSVDDYIAAQPAVARSALERVRKTIRKALPGASEGISYQIPVYRLDGRMVLYFAGFKNHYSIYPATARVVSALEKDLAGRLHNKATIRFSFTDAVPARLISRIAKVRAAEVAEIHMGPAKQGTRKTAPKKARSKAGTKRVGKPLAVTARTQSIRRGTPARS